MRPLTTREKRTVTVAGVAIVGYLFLFYGIAAWRGLEERLAEARQIELSAAEIELAVTKELKKRKSLLELRGSWKIDLGSLDEQTIVSETRDAIQKAAGALGVGLGASQEIGRRPTANEIRVIQFSGKGKTPAVMTFIDQLPQLGYPLVIDRIQLKGVPKKPGQLTVNMSVAILNFRAWQEGKKSV